MAMLRKNLISLSALALACGVHAQAPNIVGYEYWFDQNHEARVTVQVTPAPVLDLSKAPLNTTGLALGQHVVHMRWQDLADGQSRWSSVVSRNFHVSQPGPWEITALRYWWSNDAEPALDSDMRYLVFQTPQSSIDHNGLMELCGFPTGQQTLKFQLRDNHGQWSAVVTRTVTIQPAGILGTPQVTASQQVYCPGDIVTLTATPPTGSGFAVPTSYEWTIPEGTGWEHVPSSTNTISVTIGTTSGIVQVASRNFCGTSSSALLSLTIPQVPDQPSEIVGPLTVCVGSALDYSIAQTVDITYAWSVDGMNWSGVGIGNIYDAQAGTEDATITVIPLNTCGVEGLAQTIDITVDPAPDAGSDGSLLTCSDGGVLDLSASLGGTPQVGGSWSGPSPVIGGEYDPSTMEPGIYTYTVTGNALCPDAVAGVTVSENVAPVVLPSTIPGTGLIGEILSFAIVPIDGAEYLWSLPDDWVTVDPTGALVEASVEGDWGEFQVCVAVTLEACTPATSCFDVTVAGTVGQNEISRPDSWLSVYPNPSAGLFHVVPSALWNGPIELSIYDALGQLVYGPRLSNDHQAYTVRMEEQPNGFYFVRVVGAWGVKGTEVILQR